MNAKFRLIVVTLVLGAAASGVMLQRIQQTVRAETPSQTQLEYRVDNRIREAGTIESAQSIELRCEVRGGSTILFIVPEGSTVKKEDLLVELDGSTLRENLDMAQIQLAKCRAQVTQSQTAPESTEVEGESMIYLALCLLSSLTDS